MKHAEIFIILGIAAIVTAILLIGLNIKEPDKDNINYIANSEDKDNTNITNINKENINKAENISNISSSAPLHINSSENTSKIKRYIYKQTLENYTTILYVENYTSSDGNVYIVIEANDNPKKEEFELKKYEGGWTPNIKCPPCESTITSNYVNRTIFINQKTKNVKIANVPWLTLFKKENNIIYKKLTYPTGEGKWEENYKSFNYNNVDNMSVETIKNIPDLMFLVDILYPDNISVERIGNIEDLIFSFDILYFQDLKNIEKCNITGIKNVKLIKTECNNESGMELVCNMGGCNNYTMYNCYSFWNITYNLTYREETNNKKNISKSWTEKYECEIGLTEEQEKEQKNQHSRYCDGFNLHPSFDKMYFAGTENFNGKITYKIIYEKFENVSEISIWHFVDTFLIDKEEGIILKATAKNRWISNDVPDEFITTKEIVLEKEDN